LKQRAIQLHPCGSGRECIRFRGTSVAPVVCIDERPASGGIAELRAYPKESLYRIEVHERGRMIRAYTMWFMGQVQAGRISMLTTLRVDGPHC